MITVPVIQAFFIGLLRLAAMGAALYLYRDAHGDQTTLAAAGGLAFFAVTGQAFDVWKVAQQFAKAQTTTTVAVQQPAGSPPPTITATTDPADPGH